MIEEDQETMTTTVPATTVNSKNAIILTSTEINKAINTCLAVTTAGTSSGSKRERTNVNSKDDQHSNSITSTGASNKPNNSLMKLIPGYTAPMSLDSSPLDIYKKEKHRSGSGQGSSFQSSKLSVINTNPSNFTYKNFKMSITDPSINNKKLTNAGSPWFGFEATPDSSSLQTDIAIIRNRTYLDPKKFYKSSDFKFKNNNGKRVPMVQLGTVIEGSMESVYSNRLTKKQRKSNLLEEVMGEVFQSKDDYVKKKYTNMQREKSKNNNYSKRRNHNVKNHKKR